MRELQDLYREGLVAQIEALELAAAALAEGNTTAVESVRRIAHALKGSGTSYGFPQVSAQAEAVETANDEAIGQELDRLIDLLREVAGETSAGSTILVVEDDPLIRRLLEMKLTGPSRRVVAVESLAEAERCLATGPNAVVLDLFLPDADGRGFLARLRSDPRTATIPVIVLSGADNALARAESFALGADAYVDKPFDPDELSALLSTLLRRRGGAEPAADPRAEAIAAYEAAGEGSLVLVEGAVEDPPMPGHAWGDDGTVYIVAGEEPRSALKRFEPIPADLRIAAVRMAGRTLPQAVAAARSLLRRSDGGHVAETGDRSGPRRVLLAEDDPLVAALVVHRLQREGFEVIHRTDGKAALEAAKDGDLSVAVLDVKMPGMDGFELLERLRALPGLEGVPILMLTGMGSERDVVRAFDLGADDYILKPFSPAELTARLERLIER